MAMMLIPALSQAQGTAEQNKEIIGKIYAEAINGRNLERLNDYIAAEYTGVKGLKGPAGFRNAIEEIIAAFPDAQWKVEEMIAEGDKVFVRWTFTGTHHGQFQHIPATGKTVSNTGMAVYMLKNGQVTGTQVYTDRLSFMQQLGILPEDLTTLGRKT